MATAGRIEAKSNRGKRRKLQVRETGNVRYIQQVRNKRSSRGLTA